jgi:hypothetical protein
MHDTLTWFENHKRITYGLNRDLFSDMSIPEALAQFLINKFIGSRYEHATSPIKGAPGGG